MKLRILTLLCGLAVLASGQTNFVNDTFTDADGTWLSSHTGELGATWAEHSNMAGGNATITSNALRSSTSSQASMFYASGVPSSADYYVQADLKVGAAFPAYSYLYPVVGRANLAAQTWYFAGIEPGSPWAWKIFKYVNGTQTQLGSTVNVTLTTNTTYTLRLDMSGTTIRLLVNGTEVISATDSSITAAGRVGLQLYDNIANNFTIDNFSAAGAATSATTATLSGPTTGQSGVASTNFSVAVDGNYTGTITPATSGSGTFTPSSLTWAGTADTKTFTYTPTSTAGSPHSVSITGSPSLTYSGSPVSYTVTAGPAQILVNDADWFFSPYNWKANGTTYNETNNPGAYFKTRFSGTSCKIGVDVSHLVAASVSAGNYPTITWQVDGGAKTRVQLTSGQTEVDLGSFSAGTHDLVVQFVAAWWQTDRWTTPVMSLRVTKLILGNSQDISAPTLQPGRMLVFGDSHSEGYEAIGEGVSVTNVDAGVAFGNLLGARFGCEYGIIGFAGQGYNALVTNANVPDLEDAWDFYWNGQTRLSGGLLSPAPTYIISAHGDNDTANAALTTAVTATIAQWRAAAPAAKIFIVVPPNRDAEFKQSEIQDGVTAAADANTWFIDTGENLLVAGPYKSGDHLSTAGHVRYANLIEAAMRAILPSPGIGYWF